MISLQCRSLICPVLFLTMTENGLKPSNALVIVLALGPIREALCTMVNMTMKKQLLST